MAIHKEGYRWAEPGTVTSASCRICDAACKIECNVFGPTSFASAIGGIHRLHDSISCPHGGSDWHNQAVDLLHEIEQTPSLTLAAVMRGDLARLLHEHQPRSVQ